MSVTPGQTYFWKVVAKVNCGSATATAGVWSFSVQGTGGGAGTVQFSSATYSVNENDGSRTITLTRSGGAGAFVVNYRTSNGTATGADYTGLNEVMSFATNETSKTFNVPIINDTLVEGNETVNLSLSNPSGGVTLGSPSTAILTIVDNDTGCTYSISSSENTVGPGNGGGSFLIDTTSSCSWSAVSDSTSWLTTSSSGSGDGRVSYNFTANPNTSPRTGRITVGGQVSTITQIGIGGAGSVQFNSTSYSANENGGDVTITVTRTGGNETGTVMYSTSNGSATGGSDYTTASGLLLFGENQMSKSFIVPILDDTTSEGNETINLALTNPALSFTLGSPSTATLTITDDEISSTTPPVILLEEGTTNRAAALDAITWLKAPFKVLNFFNFTSDNHTRVMLFTSDLAMTQPDSSQLTVRAGGVALTVENVGPIAGVTGMSASYIIVRLPDGLPSGDLPVVVTLRGLASVNSPTLAIASSGP
ncbi:MAG: Calx-beta domain-containing protein [Pyrinomonadaceae bacterium]